MIVMKPLLCLRTSLCANSLKVSETWFWGPGTKGPRDLKSGSELLSCFYTQSFDVSFYRMFMNEVNERAIE